MEKITKENKNNWLCIIGIIIFMIGFGVVLYDILSNKYINDIEEESLEIFKAKEELIYENIDKEITVTESYIEYIASIYIPKIELERGLVSPNSYLNNVEYNVEILDSSSNFDDVNGNVILAAHSGNSRVSYFKNLDKLALGDEININYQGKTYIYHIVNIYDIEKTGKAKIIRNPNVKTLTLITCRSNTNSQIVIISELIKEVSNNG